MTAVARRKVAFRLTAPVVPEHAVQRQVADVLRLEIAPAGKVSKSGVVWYSIDHANYAGEVPGIRVGRGVVGGVLDLFFLYRGMGYFIELKTEIGEVSLAQQAICTALLFAGGMVGVARTSGEVIAVLDQWGIPRNRRIAAFA